MSVAPSSPYPVQFDVVRQLTDRNRTTVFFRLFMAIPHLLIIGGLGFTASYSAAEGWDRYGGGASGLTGAVEGMAIVAWFAIIFWRVHPQGLWNFSNFYMHWLTYFGVYFALLRDDYPPFGEGDYPVTLDVGAMPANESRNRWSVGLRVIYAIPHFIVLIFLGVAAFLVTIISWFAIVFTGNHPEGLYTFVVGVMRWSTRVQAYMLLMQDEYPPFSME